MTDTAAAYQTTTEPLNKQQPDRSKIHLGLKVCQLLFSFIAFICEEIITQCQHCYGLYFFEFVSCSAFLISILMLVVYYVTPLTKRINIPSFRKVDFWITLVTGIAFFIASIVFISTIEKSSLADASAAFGFLASVVFLVEIYFMYNSNYLQKKETPKMATSTNGGAEGEPLNVPVQENRQV